MTSTSLPRDVEAVGIISIERNVRSTVDGQDALTHHLAQRHQGVVHLLRHPESPRPRPRRQPQVHRDGVVGVALERERPQHHLAECVKTRPVLLKEQPNWDRRLATKKRGVPELWLAKRQWRMLRPPPHGDVYVPAPQWVTRYKLI